MTEADAVDADAEEEVSGSVAGSEVAWGTTEGQGEAEVAGEGEE